MTKTKKFKYSMLRLICGAALIAVVLIVIPAAKANPEAVRERFSPFSRAACDVLSRVFSVFPFSFVEISAYLGIAAIIASILLLALRWGRRGGWLSVIRWFSYIFIIASCVLFVFVFTWGLNYYASPLSDYLELDVEPRSQGELYETAEYYLELMNEYSVLVRRDENGVADLGSFQTLADQCADGYTALAQVYPVFEGSYEPPKKVLFWQFMSRTQITGIFVPFTAECNINPDCAPTSMPFTIMHEMAHRFGFAPEDEANFTALLACRESSVPEYLYSGYYTAFVYCYNAVAKIDKDKQAELWNAMSEGASKDVVAAITHYQRYEGKISKVADKVNDTYLKTMNQEAGVESYGNVVDLLIADYMKFAND